MPFGWLCVRHLDGANQVVDHHHSKKRGTSPMQHRETVGRALFIALFALFATATTAAAGLSRTAALARRTLLRDPQGGECGKSQDYGYNYD